MFYNFCLRVFKVCVVVGIHQKTKHISVTHKLIKLIQDNKNHSSVIVNINNQYLHKRDNRIGPGQLSRTIIPGSVVSIYPSDLITILAISIAVGYFPISVPTNILIKTRL